MIALTKISIKFKSMITSNSKTFIFFISSLLIYTFYANLLRYSPDFNDETEKLIAILMIKSGGRLYNNVFSHHGPIIFILEHFFYTIGARSIPALRIVPILISYLSILAILTSPALKSMSARFISAGSFCIGLLMLQTIYPFSLSLYQNFAGHFLFCAAALWIFPFLLGVPFSRSASFFGGLATGLAFFTGYPYICTIFFLSCIIIFKAIINKKQFNFEVQSIYYAFSGALLILTIVALWLLLYGDIKGYFVYHFYFNQIVYTQFADFEPFTIFILIIPFINFIYTYKYFQNDWLWLACFIFSLVPLYTTLLFQYVPKLSTTKKMSSNAVLFVLCMLSIMYANPRSSIGFQATTMVIYLLGFIALIFGLSFEQKVKFPKQWFLSILIILTVNISFIAAQFLTVTHLYDSNPLKYYKLKTNSLKISNEYDFKFIREIVRPDEKILALPLVPSFYIQTDRLPASGNYYFLPWQNRYSEQTLWNYKIDICADIKNNKPKVIFLDSRTKIWNINPETYLKCIIDELNTKYLRTSIKEDLWIRADATAQNPKALAAALIPKDFDVIWLPKDLQLLLLEAKK